MSEVLNEMHNINWKYLTTKQRYWIEIEIFKPMYKIFKQRHYNHPRV